jgi:hypothetical protein
MGRSSSRAALIYQHASRYRDEAIAAALGDSLLVAKQQAGRSLSGAQRACASVSLSSGIAACKPYAVGRTQEVSR